MTVLSILLSWKCCRFLYKRINSVRDEFMYPRKSHIQSSCHQSVHHVHMAHPQSSETLRIIINNAVIYHFGVKMANKPPFNDDLLHIMWCHWWVNDDQNCCFMSLTHLITENQYALKILQVFAELLISPVPFWSVSWGHGQCKCL